MKSKKDEAMEKLVDILTIVPVIERELPVFVEHFNLDRLSFSGIENLTRAIQNRIDDAAAKGKSGKLDAGADVDKAAADAIEKQLNNMAITGNKIGELLSRMHPTLQQEFMRVVVGFLLGMAAKEYTDLRNEATGALAKKLVAAVPEDELRALPFI